MNFRLVATLACLLSLPCGLVLLADPPSTLHLSALGAVDRHLAQLSRYFGSELLVYAAAVFGLAPGRQQPSQAGAA